MPFWDWWTHEQDEDALGEMLETEAEDLSAAEQLGAAEDALGRDDEEFDGDGTMAWWMFGVSSNHKR